MSTFPEEAEKPGGDKPRDEWNSDEAGRVGVETAEKNLLHIFRSLLMPGLNGVYYSCSSKVLHNGVYYKYLSVNRVETTGVRLERAAAVTTPVNDAAAADSSRGFGQRHHLPQQWPLSSG